MPTAGITHDAVLQDYDSRHSRGFMLVQKNGQRVFSTREARPIAPRTLSMGELTQAEAPPEIELIWFMDDWIGGIGGENYRNLGDRRKLGTAKKILTYPYGTLRPTRELRASTLSSAPDNYFPSGFAVAPNDATPGTAGVVNELWAFVGRDVYSGGDDNWTLETEPQALSLFYQNGLQFDKWVVAPAWNSGTDLANYPGLYIYKDPTTSTWTASTQAQGRFKFFTKARNAAGNEILWGGHNIADTTFTVSGAHNSSVTTLSLSADPTATIQVNDMLMVGPVGTAEIMLVTARQTGPNQATVVRAYGTPALTFSGGEKVNLYQPHVIRSSSDPSNTGSWSSATTIGVDDQPITGMVADEDTDVLYIAKTDGIYTYFYDFTGGTFIRNLTVEFRQQGHSGNFIGLHYWNKRLLLPLGHGGLLEYDIANGTIKDISLRLSAPAITDLHGVVVAIASDPQGIYLAVKDVTDNVLHIIAGHLVEIDGATDWRWDMIGEVGAGAALTTARTALMVDTYKDNHRRLWIGFTEASVNVVPQFLPLGNVSDDKTDGYTNDTDCEAVSVKYDANLPRVSKHADHLEVESKNLGAGGRQWTFSYRVDDETTWTTWQAANESPFQEIKFPPGTVYKILEVRAVPVMTSVGTTPPEILSLRFHSQIRPKPTKVYPMRLYLADNQLLLNGAEGGSVNGDLKQLRDWNASPTDLILYTPDKAEGRAVIFWPGSMTEQEVHKEYGRRAEYEVRFLLAEVG